MKSFILNLFLNIITYLTKFQSIRNFQNLILINIPFLELYHCSCKLKPHHPHFSISLSLGSIRPPSPTEFSFVVLPLFFAVPSSFTDLEQAFSVLILLYLMLHLFFFPPICLFSNISKQDKSCYYFELVTSQTKNFRGTLLRSELE